ncbi:MAG TPA: molybdenum cofactor guanylyltransferase MobA [Methylocystis sp.]|nr:molybdenum cofactor guanylyltransferase MobA [Methylocystis sp.]
MDETFGVILAGGLARRLGGVDKALIDIGGETILHRLVGRLAPQCAGIALNANGDASRFEGYALPVIPDGLAGYAGPLAGLLAGLDHVAATHPKIADVVTVPADTPFVPRDLVAKLRAARSHAQCRIAVAKSADRAHHAVALWPVALREDLRHALITVNLRQVSAFIARYDACVVEWPAAPLDPFFNVNEPSDIERAKQIATLAQR